MQNTNYKPMGPSIKPGDLFHIPAMEKDGERGFVIGRYIDIVLPNVGHLIEDSILTKK